MNAYAATGYGVALDTVASARDAEARLLSRLTNRLAQAAETAARDPARFMAAIHDNERFWTTAATDLASDGNRLPEGLRAALISLAGFVVGHSSKLRMGTVSVDALLEVNRSTIRGLNGTGAAS
ncbi:flagellar biosynthesis regulator FlaF [Paracoccus jeotgali]|uniref:flagellar biosynthesis regulator FlaF n=1 Tax=Paracoccus jeotgali TaxID=2065379 RepID=UPI0028AFBDBC|nr:flagellar biosynthesis regulator FlaF [Paracoccus jeotgali]